MNEPENQNKRGSAATRMLFKKDTPYDAADQKYSQAKEEINAKCTKAQT